MKNLKNTFLLILLTIVFSGLIQACSNTKKEKSTTSSPNVIFILADDLGYGDLSCLGQEKFQTPNIDRIANEGMIFTNHYSGNTVCSPSRAVLMTGQNNYTVHCRGNVKGENNISLDPEMITLPRLFKNAGYATGAFGKWGLGVTNETGAPNPMTHGFDQFSGWKSQTIAHTYYPSSYVRNGKEILLEEGTFVHDIIIQDAFDFIEKSAKAKQPFFCYIPTAVPHAAMHAPKELQEKWRKKLPEFDKKTGKYKAGPDEDCPDVINPIAGFAAMMENLDNQIGELLNMLEELGVDDNTLIVFTSDNGTHNEGGHDPVYWNSNGPFRGIKRDIYEGGIHAPCFVRWPTKVLAGSTSDHISAFWDVLPTMADLLNQPLPKQSNGISFLPTLAGDDQKQKKHDHLYWEFCRGLDQKIVAQAVRMGDWKAVRGNWKEVLSKEGSKSISEWSIELYNLSSDIGEQNNVADQHPVIMEKMKAILDQ